MLRTLLITELPCSQAHLQMRAREEEELTLIGFQSKRLGCRPTNSGSGTDSEITSLSLVAAAQLPVANELDSRLRG